MFCFSYAGAGASVYRDWPRAFSSQVDVKCIQLPGRENRLTEDPYTRLDNLVDDLATVIRPYLDKPFAFFGHSLGALVAFSLTNKLRSTSGPLPARLLVSGRRAPQLPPRKPPFYDLPDDEFIDEIRRMNGMQEELLANAELMEIILPILRADCTICDTYQYTPDSPLDCPISAFGGLDDEDVPQEDLAAWKDQTSQSFRIEMFPGDHFFLHEHKSALLQSISSDLETLAYKSTH